ncbi:hypothetical protein QQF64_029982, partial [Cirrhinus molitorella]
GALWQRGLTEASPQCKTHECPHGRTPRWHCSSPVQYSPNSDAWWWQHSAAGTGRLVAIEEKMNAAKYRDILDENLLQSAQDLRLGQSQ